MRRKYSQPRVTYGNQAPCPTVISLQTSESMQLSSIPTKWFFYDRDLNSSTGDSYRYDRTSINNSIEQPKPLFITYITRDYVINKWPHPLFSVFCNYNACRYNAVNFLTNFNQRQPIAHPLGRGIVCLSRIQHLIDILPQFLQLFMKYITILDPRFNGTRLYYSIS